MFRVFLLEPKPVDFNGVLIWNERFKVSGHLRANLLWSGCGSVCSNYTSNKMFFLPPHLSSSLVEIPSSQALTTAAARCTTCAPTRRSLATRTAAWTPASRLWPSLTQAALSSPATTTSTVTSGTPWRERKLVSEETQQNTAQKSHDFIDVIGSMNDSLGFHPFPHSSLSLSSSPFLLLSSFRCSLWPRQQGELHWRPGGWYGRLHRILGQFPQTVELKHPSRGKHWKKRRRRGRGGGREWK